MLKKTGNGLILSLLVGHCALLAGCYTGIKGRQLDSEADAKEGLRYFLPAPLLVVDEIAPNKYDARIEYSLDRSRVFAVQPTQVLATSTATIEFNDDGTLKSFQLDQDSSDVPAAFVEGLRDLELKKLELEKAALDAATAKAEKGAAAAGAARAARAEGTRTVCIHRIHGDQPTAPLECELVAVTATGTGGGGDGAAPATAAIVDDGTHVIISGAAPLGTSDRSGIAFRRGAAVLPADRSAALRDQATAVDGKLVLPLAALRAEGVTHVHFEGEDYVVR